LPHSFTDPLEGRDARASGKKHQRCQGPAGPLERSNPRFFEPLNLQVLIAFCCMQLRHTVTPGPSHLYPRPSDRFDRFSDHCHPPSSLGASSSSPFLAAAVASVGHQFHEHRQPHQSSLSIFFACGKNISDFMVLGRFFGVWRAQGALCHEAFVLDRSRASACSLYHVLIACPSKISNRRFFRVWRAQGALCHEPLNFSVACTAVTQIPRGALAPF